MARFDRAWDSVRQRVALPQKLLHDSQHTAVRNMDRAGAPREGAKRLSGHKTDLSLQAWAAERSLDMTRIGRIMMA